MAWQPVTTKVLRLVGTTDTFKQRCMAAVLDAGPDAAVSHLAAATLWGIPGFGQCRPEVSRRRSRSSRGSSLARLHDVGPLPTAHLAVIDGIPLTTVARTIFDLAALIHPARLERALDNSLARRLTSLTAVRQVAIDIGGRGRAGSAVMRKLLEVRGTDYVAPESRLEARFLQILDSANIPRPKLQCDLGGDDWIGRVDGLYADLRLVIEIDSALHHTTLLDRSADERRDAWLRAAGFHVLRITDDQIWHDPVSVVDLVLGARSAARRALSRTCP